jgi:hypothetical protein
MAAPSNLGRILGPRDHDRCDTGRGLKPLRYGPRNGHARAHASEPEIALEELEVRHMSATHICHIRISPGH